jgi:hypothetical protein
MAELQLTVRYRPPSTKIGFAAICAAAPVWSLAAPALFGMLIAYVASHPACAPTWVIVTISFLLLGITASGILGAALFEDDRIHVSKDGISLPLSLMNMRLRRNFYWSELTAGELVDEGGTPARLVLYFGARAVALRLSAIGAGEVEQLLMAVELWGTNCKRSPDLIAYQGELRKHKKGEDGTQLSYTQMWDEELSRRFANTSFVPLEPGQTLQNGKYKLVRQLAFGGFSALYVAQMNKLDLVVLKEAVVPASANEDARRSAEEHLAREARLLFTLSHPQIARVLDYFVEDGRHYMTLEQIAGQDLRQYVRQNGPQPQNTVIDWSLQLTRILEYLHGQAPPVIHRDLTPDNVVLKNDGTLVLIDFGASNQFVGTATGTLIGKQAYMAPEQLRGKAVPQSDIYSLGGTMYFLLTGKEPTPLLEAHPRQINADVSEELDKVVAAATALDLPDRISSAGALETALEAAAEHEIDHASSVG